jgi:hypothetical protein
MFDSTTLTSLTKIKGKPEADTIRLLQRELFNNAGAIPTTLGGGEYGHLGNVMRPALYDVLPGALPYADPIHPGPHPGHAGNATGVMITETNRLYKEAVEASNHHSQVTQALKKLLLEAVDNTYVAALNHDILGYALVSCFTLLNHLWDTYGVITPDQLSANFALLSSDWNPDSPIEDLWTRIQECCRFATQGGETIQPGMVVREVLKVIEKSALLAMAVTDWRKRPQPEWTLENFKRDFTHANTERIRCLTVGNTGHSAFAATAPPTGAPLIPSITTNGIKMYYCWSHGLGTNSTHCSGTCNNKREGHIDNATAVTIQGGCARIMTGGSRNGASTAGA